MDKIKIAKLNEGAIIPSRKNPDDAGLDIYANEAALIAPLASKIIHSGITLEIDTGFVGLVLPKSRNDFLIGGGVVDAGYQGEILVKVMNVFQNELKIEKGQGIAQLVILPIATPLVQEVSVNEIHQTETPRGTSGGMVSQLNL